MPKPTTTRAHAIGTATELRMIADEVVRIFGAMAENRNRAEAAGAWSAEAHEEQRQMARELMGFAGKATDHLTACAEALITKYGTFGSGLRVKKTKPLRASAC